MTRYGREFARASLKRNYLPYALRYLDGLGKDNIKFAVRKNITIWELLPDGWKRRAIEDNSIFSRLAANLEPNEVADMVYDVLVEVRPDYAKIITKEWLARSFEAYKRAKAEVRTL
ncbi:MAG: hypothetical protein DRI26_02805 [Chloroflexi bacterium]|nr:MAG: hypothetical protein DRI26_02805 [Chloroflexota bacterium]